MSIKVTSIWSDLRESVADYKPAELLDYYRVSKWYIKAHTNKPDDKAGVELTTQMCNAVDEVFEIMRCMPDYRAVIISEILRREYCDEPLSTADKITKAQVSRTTYYTYLKQGESLFSEICTSIISEYTKHISE